MRQGLNSLVYVSAKAIGSGSRLRIQTLWGVNFRLEHQFTWGTKSTITANLVYDAGVSPLKLMWLRSQIPQLTFPLCPVCISPLMGSESEGAQDARASLR